MDPAELHHLQQFEGGRFLLESAVRAGLVPQPLNITGLDAYVERLLSDASGWVSLLLRQFYRFSILDAISARPRARRDPNRDSDKHVFRTAFMFLRHLDRKGMRTGDLTDHVVNSWLRVQPPSYRSAIKVFLTWLFRSRLVPMALSGIDAKKTTLRTLEAERFLEVIYQARTDVTLPLAIRVALLLVALCGKTCVEIVRLKAGDIVRTASNQIEVRFAKGLPQVLEGEVGDLVLQLASSSRRWLFPSQHRPGQPVMPRSLRVDIRKRIPVNLAHLANSAKRTMLDHIDLDEFMKALGFAPSAAVAWKKRVGGIALVEKRYLAQYGRAEK